MGLIERDKHFSDVDDGPDPSRLVRSESGKYYRRDMEKKMVVEFNEAEFSQHALARTNI